MSMSNKVCFDSSSTNKCDLLREIVKADLQLYATKPDTKCWSREVCDALASLPGIGQGLVQTVRNKQVIHMGTFEKALRAHMARPWAEARAGKPWEEEVQQRRLVTYEHWFGMVMGEKGCPPVICYNI